MKELPSWLALFAPLPPDTLPQRKPVASPQQMSDRAELLRSLSPSFDAMRVLRELSTPPPLVV